MSKWTIFPSIETTVRQTPSRDTLAPISKPSLNPPRSTLMAQKLPLSFTLFIEANPDTIPVNILIFLVGATF